MANEKISQFDENTIPTNDDVFPIVNNGDTKKMTLSGLTSFISSSVGLTITDIVYGGFGGMLNLYTSGTMTVGFYNISGTGTLADSIIIQAISPTNTTLNATGLFFNADYQNVGNYSGTTMGTQLGVWNSDLTPSLHDFVIWYGIHYQNLTGVVGTEPNSDAVNWVALSKQLDLGYILESDYIEYDIPTNTILKRIDKRGNEIGQGNVSFQWGNDNTNHINNLIGITDILNNRGTLNHITILNSGGFQLDNTFTGAISQTTFNSAFNITANFTDGGGLLGCNITSHFGFTFDPNKPYHYNMMNGIESDFPHTFEIDGLTNFDFTVSSITHTYIGVVNLTSANATESIATFSNFPVNQPVRFYPAAGLTVTFISSTTFANEPHCAGGVDVVLNGDNGDWVEFTKNGSGYISRIYQTKGETY